MRGHTDSPNSLSSFPNTQFQHQNIADGVLHPTIEVVAAILLNDAKIFATQRGYGKWKGWWEFPGGKVAVGESLEEALKREILEELDAHIVTDSFFCTVEYDYPDFHLVMHCYLCHFADEHIHLVEHLAARWLGSDELDEVQWLPADLGLIQQLRTFLSPQSL